MKITRHYFFPLFAVLLLGVGLGQTAQAQIVPAAPLPMVAPVTCTSVHKITLNVIFSEDGIAPPNSYWLFWTGAVMPDGVHYHVGDYRSVNKGPGVFGGVVGIDASLTYDSATKLYKLEWKEGSVDWCVTSPRSEIVSTTYDIEVKDRASEPTVPRVKLPNPSAPVYVQL